MLAGPTLAYRQMCVCVGWGCIEEVLRRIFQPTRKKPTGSWRKIHNEELESEFFREYYQEGETGEDDSKHES
jgi:hypothetical protein